MSHHRREAFDWNDMSVQDVPELAIADEEGARDY
jgi:hypothetical protein